MFYRSKCTRWMDSVQLVILWMASCIPNSLSFQGWGKTSPNCLFGWNIGRKRADDKPQIKYHDIDLTFPTSLVDNTFLKGTVSFSLSLSPSFKLEWASQLVIANI